MAAGVESGLALGSAAGALVGSADGVVGGSATGAGAAAATGTAGVGGCKTTGVAVGLERANQNPPPAASGTSNKSEATSGARERRGGSNPSIAAPVRLRENSSPGKDIAAAETLDGDDGGGCGTCTWLGSLAESHARTASRV